MAPGRNFAGNSAGNAVDDARKGGARTKRLKTALHEAVNHFPPSTGSKHTGIAINLSEKHTQLYSKSLWVGPASG